MNTQLVGAVWQLGLSLGVLLAAFFVLASGWDAGAAKRRARKRRRCVEDKAALRKKQTRDA